MNHPYADRGISWGAEDDQLSDNNLLNRLRDENFDVAINEATALCGYALTLKIGVKKLVSAMPISLTEKFIEPFAIDVNPSHIPGKKMLTTSNISVALSRSTDLMGFWERVYNVISLIIISTFAETVTMPTTVQLLRKYFGPSIDSAYALDVAAQSTFLLANGNEFIEFPRPINRKIVYVSDVGVGKPQPLNEEFRNLMDSAKGGVMLVSMGSIAASSRMPMSIKNAFVSSFRAFPNISFIWKYEEDDDLGCDSQNIIKKKWIPQSDLLAHANMRAFLSHCGITSMAESLRAGVPMICIPLFFDQRQNAKKMEKHHATIVIEKDNITTTSISWALRSVLSDKRLPTYFEFKYSVNKVEKRPPGWEKGALLGERRPNANGNGDGKAKKRCGTHGTL
uniref:UDP-glucuronosyltransferase n=1 Tax=Ascaris lumbricoides TaxID=6252 RepID=A0A0M3HRW4_ASCLU